MSIENEVSLQQLLAERENLLKEYPNLEMIQKEIDEFLNSEQGSDPIKRAVLLNKKMLECYNKGLKEVNSIWS